MQYVIAVWHAVLATHVSVKRVEVLAKKGVSVISRWNIPGFGHGFKMYTFKSLEFENLQYIDYDYSAHLHG